MQLQDFLFIIFHVSFIHKTMAYFLAHFWQKTHSNAISIVELKVITALWLSAENLRHKYAFGQLLCKQLNSELQQAS